eukprot:scaffold180786_cov24-Tisochrysis_lutea.AAC.1
MRWKYHQDSGSTSPSLPFLLLEPASSGVCMSPPLPVSLLVPMRACREPVAFHAVDAIVIDATSRPTMRSSGDSCVRLAKGLQVASGWEARAE